MGLLKRAPFGAGKALVAALVLGAGMAASLTSLAAPVVYDFEGIPDSTALIGQIPGATFANARVIVAGISLNEFEFPPRSGLSAVFDDGGAITIDFSGTVFGIGAYFTYLTALTFNVYDSSSVLLSSQSSAFNNNLLLSGDATSSPNEFLSFSAIAGNIGRVVISGATAGSSFVMDDLTIDAGNSVPEPQTLALVAGLMAVGSMPGGWLRRRSRT